MTDQIKVLNIKDIDCELNNFDCDTEILYIRYRADYEKAIRLLERSPADRKICIVGSRKHTEYGFKVTKEILKTIAPYNPIIISGLAIGIDTIVLETALEYRLRTIAVIGSGLDDDSIYPRENLPLVNDILNNGGIIISKHREYEKAMPWHFPKRNAVMAGLANTIIIIEGTEKSGTLITARLGLDYGKDIIAIPGSIFSPLSQGPLTLINQGATPLPNITALSHLLNFKKPDEKYLDRYKDMLFKDGDKEQHIHLNKAELELLKYLDQPREKQELIEQTGKNSSDLQILLIQMEMKGLIEEKLGKIVRL